MLQLITCTPISIRPEIKKKQSNIDFYTDLNNLRIQKNTKKN